MAQRKTATEVISDNSKTFKTKAEAYEKNNLATGVELICLDAMRSLIRELFVGEPVPTPDTPFVFDDSVRTGTQKATYWINLYASGLAPLSLVLEKVHGVSKEGS